MRVPSYVSRRPVVTAFLAAGVVLLAFVVYWFQPQQLFLSKTVNESVPKASVKEVAGSGEFFGLAHETTGKAEVLELDDGSQILRFENFETDNGPDLKVYLAAEPADGDEDAFDDDFIDLGGLKGNKGNQNYELPADVDLTKYKTAVIWCRRFSVAFGASALE
jgi:hypothetical protein